jgi:glycosyltransferase involved in cell wall biosynthesis
VPEVVEHRRTGLLVTAGSRVELAGALVSVTKDQHLREAFGSVARTIMAARFSPEQEFRETETVYLRLLDHPKGKHHLNVPTKRGNG